MKHLIAIWALFGLVSCHTHNIDTIDTTATVDTVEVAGEQTMSLDEAIGQMLLVGFRGTEIDSNHHIVRDIRDYHVGSVILFDYDAPTGTRGRNIKSPEQLRELCSQLRSYNPSLLIGIDQEGGYVSRLSKRYGFPYIMSAQKSARLGDDTVRHYAALTAETLASLGINLNFAPVADVNVNPSCPVIGGMERSFSADADRVRQCCQIWYEEQKGRGVTSCLKHFPGHGSAKGDTHKGLVDVSDTWKSIELDPYRGLPSEHMMVMTAHVINRQLDPSGLPASLSPRITAYLRDTLGFEGVIVTDDLAMGAIVLEYSFRQTIRMALESGADLLCLSNNGGRGYDPQLVPKTVAIIKQLVEEGVVTEERIYRSAARVQASAAF